MQALVALLNLLEHRLDLVVDHVLGAHIFVVGVDHGADKFIQLGMPWLRRDGNLNQVPALSCLMSKLFTKFANVVSAAASRCSDSRIRSSR